MNMIIIEVNYNNHYGERPLVDSLPSDLFWSQQTDWI